MGIFESILSGGLTGLLGVVVQRIADYKNKQLDIQISREKNEHDIKMREVDALIMAQEWAARTQVATIEAESKMDVADSAAFASSFNEPVRYSEGVKPTKFAGSMLILLDFIRGIVRPGLTIYLCVLTTMIYFQAKNLIGEGLDPLKAYDLLNEIVGTVLYLTVTCLLWWFGVRNKAKKLG